MPPRTHLLAAAVALPLAACGAFADVSETVAKGNQVAEELEAALGVEPFVGWNVSNGILTSVNVEFPRDAVAAHTVGELHQHVARAVGNHFPDPPGQLVVSIVQR
jgi:hypothetical protein